MKRTLLALLCGTALGAGIVYAVGNPVPNIFQNGTIADADEVNENFQDLADRIDINSTDIAAIPGVMVQYDYTDYITASNITQKTFTLLGSCGGTSATATWNYTRTAVGADTRIERTQIRFDGTSTVCRYQTNTFMANASQYEWQRQDNYDISGTTITSSNTYNRPIPWFTSSMISGIPWGGATDSSTSSLYTIEKVELMGLESITVPYNGGTTYNDCLKVHRLRSRSSGNGNTFSRISWHCPGMGEVKRMQVHASGGFASLELTGIQ